MLVQNAANVQSYAELGISKGDQDYLEAQPYTIQELILALRKDPRGPEDGKNAVIYRRIYDNLYVQGFIRDDLDLTFAYGKFLDYIFQTEDEFLTDVNQFRTNEWYEKLTPISKLRREALHVIIERVALLSNREIVMVKRYFNLDGLGSLDITGLAKEFNCAESRIISEFKGAIKKLRTSESRLMLRLVFYCDEEKLNVFGK